MLAVVLDTNAIYRDPWLTRETGRKLLRLAEAGACVVMYPEVVVDELRRQRYEAAQHAHDLAAKAVEAMAKAGVDVTKTSAGLASNLRQMSSDLDSAFASVVERPNVVVVPLPKVEVAGLLKRDLERRRPFMEIESGQKKKSVGFRDVLIWETVLEVLQGDTAYELALFVSSDSGFLSDDSKELHPHLLDDLDSHGIGRERITMVKSIPQAITEVEEALARDARAAATRTAEEAAPPGPEEDVAGPAEPGPETTDTGISEGEPSASEDKVAGISRADLVAVATDALYGLANRDVSMQMVYGGDYDYPDFVKFTMPNVESGFLSYVDQTTEFMFEESATAPGQLIATADAVISIEGAIFKGDWFVDDSASVNIMGELNDHYFETSSEVEVRVVVELDTDGDRIDVIDVVLEDPPAQKELADDVIESELPD